MLLIFTDTTEEAHDEKPRLQSTEHKAEVKTEPLEESKPSPRAVVDEETLLLAQCGACGRQLPSRKAMRVYYIFWIPL